MGKIIGIDLGTTNSCVAVMEGGDAIIIPNASGQRTTPSVVAFTPSGERLVGDVAKRQAVTNSAQTVFSIKRDMGSTKRIKVGGKQRTPQEISAIILQKLKADAEQYLGTSVTDAVITVPAYFTDSQRQATKDAGTIAGLTVQRIINEPTAAALAYQVDRSIPQKIMVYDLGGGTFDVSILDINQDVIEVLSTAGNNRLGGDDFDACVTDHLVREFREKQRIDLSKNQMALFRVREAAEKAKIELSSTTQTEINLPFLSGDTHMQTVLTRPTFESLTRHLVQATEKPMQQAMRDAGLTPKDLSQVLLVGGSTRIPAVQAAVQRYTGLSPNKSINPDECVAKGAALQGGVLIGEVNGLLLLDVTPFSLGIETVGNVFAIVINRNTTLPISQNQIFTTAADFQSAVDVHVLQGENPTASANQTLGRFRLSGIRRAMRGVPQIQVTFNIDTNGIVSVSAKDLDTGQQQSIVITGSSNMHERDIQKAIGDAKMHAEMDANRKSLERVQNSAEQLGYYANDFVSTLHGQPKRKLQDAIAAHERARSTQDARRIGESIESLLQMMEGLGWKKPEDFTVER